MARAAISAKAAAAEPSTVDEVYAAFETGFKSRKYTAGLLLAFIDMFLHLRTFEDGFRSWDDFIDKYPPLDTNRRGAANTLTIAHKGNQLTLRKFYDPIETFFRAECSRMDYPNCAPHATQAWGEARYRPWLNVLVTLDEGELLRLRHAVVEFVLATLPDHSEFDACEAQGKPYFSLVLSDFDMSAQKGERAGAPYQGIVFAYLRTDNPHLQLSAAKVRSGGARHGAVGDVDCWEGTRLALSAEVKHFVMSKDDVFRELSDFAERIRMRASLGLAVVQDFENGAREAVREMGLVPLTQSEILEQTKLWEPAKQRIAIDHAFYAFLRLEMSQPLTARFQAFIEQVDADT